eukprot:sb/3462364/
MHTVLSTVTGVIVYDNRQQESGSGQLGTLCLCQYGIFFCLSSKDTQCHHQGSDTMIFIPIKKIKNLLLNCDGRLSDFYDYSTFEDVNPERLILTVYGKDFSITEFHFPRKDEQVDNFLMAIRENVFGRPIVLLTQNGESCQLESTQQSSGILSFLDKVSWEVELSRLKVNEERNRWKVAQVANCRVKESYAKFMVIQHSKSPGDIDRLGQEHTNQKFMTWSWTDPVTMVPLLRCSEPKIHLDKKYLNLVLNTISDGNAKTRAVTSQATLRDSCPDENEISLSYEKFWNTCMTKDSDNFYRSLESSKWLHWVQTFIRASRHTARRLVVEKQPVVVMDPTGRDVSCVVVSLVQILVDKYYRTSVGFANLINKEWIAAGYPFRRNLISINGKDSRFLPTFFLFLDCVQTIIAQYPAEFEFTDLYLTMILDEIYEGDSEAFMFNCPREYEIACKGAEIQAVESFWVKLLESKSKFRNPLYDFKDKVLCLDSRIKDEPEADDIRYRTESYSMAVIRGISDQGIEDALPKRRISLGKIPRNFKKMNPFQRRKRKKKGEKSSKAEQRTSSFYVNEFPRERLKALKNIFKSSYDPINVSYALLDIIPWDRYIFRHQPGLLGERLEGEERLAEFAAEFSTSCAEFIYHPEETHDDILAAQILEEDEDGGGELRRSASQNTLASEAERSVHVSEIDLFHDNGDYESMEELSMNGLDNSLEGSLVRQGSEKRLSHVQEEPEMSNRKSPQTVVLEIEEATNDIHDV